MALIEIQAVEKLFGANGAAGTGFQVLKGIDLNIEEGEFVSIIGPSGSGKSTLLSILGGLTPPSKGSVVVDDIPIYTLPQEQLADFRREYIGFVFQQFHLIPYLTTVENVMLPLSIIAGKDNEKLQLATACLGKVGLKEKAKSLPSQLSGGEQQRVAIARALVNEPPIILADEPTGNLDSETGEEVFKVFTSLNQAGQTIVLITHNPELAARTHRTVSLRDGMMV